MRSCDPTSQGGGVRGRTESRMKASDTLRAQGQGSDILRLLGTDEAKRAWLIDKVLRVVLGRDAGDFFVPTVKVNGEYEPSQDEMMEAYM